MLRVASIIVALLFTIQVHARELTVGLTASVTAIDPHFFNLGVNISLSRHFFDPLILQSEDQQLMPGLATAWRAIDDLTWEFVLRRGVMFHDGSGFTAHDVAFTLRRAANVPNSPGSFAIYIRQVKEIVVVDDYTIRLTTKEPSPQLPRDMSTFGIIPRSIAQFSTTADFSTGRAMIGTGPFKFVEWIPGDKVQMVRNEAYWGEKPAWDRVTFKIVSNARARVAGLLSGVFDMIENVPTNDIETLHGRKNIALARRATNRIIYFGMDVSRDTSPFVTDRAGKVLAQNPLKDLRVRQAMSKAINRAAIAEKVMDGVAVPASQLLPAGFYGVSPNLQVEKFDPEGARRLLRAAGFAEGFDITLHCPNDAYVNDEQICLAVAQMFGRVGIMTSVKTMPRSVYNQVRTSRQISFWLAGWSSESGESSGPLKGILATLDEATGWGYANYGRYSNSAFDEVLQRALGTMDDRMREKLLGQATEIAIADTAIIPLHHQVSVWGMRASIRYAPRADDYTLAHLVRPAMN
jgi:peptide/nickel transport system substrate-binding protein